MRRPSCFGVQCEHSSMCGRLVDQIRVSSHVAPIHDRYTSSQIRHVSERQTTGNGTRSGWTLFERNRHHARSRPPITLNDCVSTKRTHNVAFSIVHSHSRSLVHKWKIPIWDQNSDHEKIVTVRLIVYNLELITSFKIYIYSNKWEQEKSFITLSRRCRENI